MKTKKEIIDVTTGWINLNTGCNNRCLWCYRKGDFTSRAESIDFGMATQIVDFFCDLRIYSCIFIGGEPTLYDGLVDLVRKAKIGGIKEVTVVTNGRLLKNPKLVNEIEDVGLDVFSISIHSANEKTHNIIARTDSWQDTVSGIKNVIAVGGNCSLNVVAGNQNVDEIPESLPIFLGWGVKKIIVSCAIPHINGKKIDGSFALEPRRFAALVEKLTKQSKNVVILHELPLCLISRKTFLCLARENRLGYGCHIGVGRGLSIDVDGNAIPCNSFPHHPILQLFKNGKMKYSSDSFQKVWGSNKTILALRKEANVFRSSVCKKCELWEMCNCGCPLTWGYFNPDDYINDGLYGIKAKTVYNWTKRRYNP